MGCHWTRLILVIVRSGWAESFLPMSCMDTHCTYNITYMQLFAPFFANKNFPCDKTLFVRRKVHQFFDAVITPVAIFGAAHRRMHNFNLSCLDVRFVIGPPMGVIKLEQPMAGNTSYFKWKSDGTTLEFWFLCGLCDIFASMSFVETRHFLELAETNREAHTMVGQFIGFFLSLETRWRL